MALPNRLHTATLSYEGGEIILQATLDALEALKADTGCDPIEYIGNALNVEIVDGATARAKSPTEYTRPIVDVLYHLQTGETRESKASIYAWLFPDVMGFVSDEAAMTALATALFRVMGKDLSEVLAQIADEQKSKARSKKAA